MSAGVDALDGGTPILRPYQERAIAETRAHIARGCRAPLIVSPTGSGKTVIGAEIGRRHLSKGGAGVLWLAHRRELIEQAAARLESLGLEVGLIAASESHRANTKARVQVASVQTLRRRRELPPASLVVFDEAHHFVADDWGELGRAYESAIRIGLTATPERGDGQGLGELFDGIVVAATVRELTELGHLVPCEVVAPGRLLQANEIAQHPVDAYLSHGRGRRTLVFAPHVKAATEYLYAFLNAGVRAALVHGRLEHMERSDILRRYRTGGLDVLVNVYVLTEGFDDPPTACAIIARGCQTPGIYLQVVGRILRPAEGKRDALVLDLRGVTHLHGHPALDRQYSLEGRGIRAEEEEQPEARHCAECGAVLPEGTTQCPECGAAREMKMPTVIDASLERYGEKRRESDEKRISTLARWLRVAEDQGFKSGWAQHKYRIVYGDWAPWPIRNAALERARRAT